MTIELDLNTFLSSDSNKCHIPIAWTTQTVGSMKSKDVVSSFNVSNYHTCVMQVKPRNSEQQAVRWNVFGHLF